MKKTILITAILALTGAGYATFTTTQKTDISSYHPEDPRSGGAAALLGQDRTGGPLSVGTCVTCHAPTGSTTSISAVLKDEFGAGTTSYDAGEDYTMEFTVINNLFNRFGFQANALTAGNGQGGDFTTAISANTQISNVGGVEYPEHLGAKSGLGTTIFIVNWVAPVNGTGAIDVYGIGMGVNLNGGTSGDATSVGGGSGSLISINEAPPTLISYPSAVYCTSDAAEFPLFSGNITGTYTAAPVGLSINPASGEIDPALSSPGNYTVDYVYGSGPGGIVSTAVQINGSDASFIYSAATYCQNDSDPLASITGDIGGIFSGPAGVVFVNTSTGEVDLSASTAGGPYTITYTLPAPCPDVNAFDITINIVDDPSFTYASSYCQADADPVAGSIATPGGIFSGPAQLSFTDINTGEIDLGASTAGGPYTITYTTSGGCPDILTQDIIVGAEYTESVGVTICEDEIYLFGTLTLDSSDVGLNSQLFTSVYGCDSTVDLTLSTTVIDSTVTISGLTITATESGANYQWIDCDSSNAAIPGETGQAFTPTVNGNYAVEISIGSCTEVSECTMVNVPGSGLSENDNGLIVLYPNPATEQFQLGGMDKLTAISSISIVDMNGKVVANLSVDQYGYDISEIAAGIYQLIIIYENGDGKLRLIKE